MSGKHGDDDNEQDQLGGGPEFHEDPKEIADAASEVIARGNSDLQHDIVDLSLHLSLIDEDYQAPGLRLIQSERYIDPNSGVRRQDGADKIEEKEQAVKAVLDKNSSGDKVADDDKKQKNAAKYLLLLGLVVAGATVGLVMTALNRKAHDKDDDDLPLPEDVKQSIEALVKSWKELPEDKYWGQIASYARDSQDTMADLIFFMQYTMSLSPLKSPWLWNSNLDKNDCADKLVAAYKGKDIAAFFNQVPALRYQREDEPNAEPLPRYIAADLAQLALGQLTLP